MKIIIIIFLVVIVVVLIFQSFLVMSANKTEEQKYSLIRKYKDFEIRFYPSATIATINSDAKTYKELSGPGFRKLANYIFGGNKTNTKISMTSPVQMDINDSLSTMSFVMPSAYSKKNLPKPNDPNVQIKNTADEYVAVIRFGGYASDKDIKFYSEKLQKLLKENGISSYGHFRFLGYNPPFQFIGRRNEIIVKIKWENNMNEIKIGSSIPAFTLPDQNGNLFDINSVIGKNNLVIYFYPKDDSPGCTAQACSFRDQFEVFKDADALIIGISSQSVESHKEFAQKHRLNFTLLSDQDNKIRKQFGVPANLLGILPGRVTYIADKTGKVIYIFNSQTQATKHVDEALRILKELK